MALVLAVALLILEADMPRRKSPVPKPDPATDALLQTLNPHAAGIDLSDDEHWVCVPEGSVPTTPRQGHDSLPEHVRRFGACTADLRSLIAWLRQAGVDTVAMEATGVYWVPLYDLLEAEGFRVLLVDPHQTQAVPGRPKTDVKDCMWIQRLHSLGLLSAAFRPEEPIRVLRSYQRHRASLVEDASRFILRHAEGPGADERQADRGARRRHGRDRRWRSSRPSWPASATRPNWPNCASRGCKHDEAGIARALEGTWRPEHLFALRQSLASVRVLPATDRGLRPGHRGAPADLGAAGEARAAARAEQGRASVGATSRTSTRGSGCTRWRGWT